MLSLKTKLVTFWNVLSWCFFWSCSIMSLKELKIYIHLLYLSALVFFTCFLFLCVYKILSFSHLNLKRLKENNQYHYYFLMILFLIFCFYLLIFLSLIKEKSIWGNTVLSSCSSLELSISSMMFWLEDMCSLTVFISLTYSFYFIWTTYYFLLSISCTFYCISFNTDMINLSF